MSAPTLHVKSKIAGKNADVFVYPDRIEYGKTGWMGTGAKATLGVFTAGASLLATGLGSKNEKTAIPMKAITMITAKKDGLINSIVTFHTSVGTIEVKCSHSDAKELQATVQRHMLG